MADYSIKLYSFDKRENSTKRISNETALDVSGVMLDNTSILTPSFRLLLNSVPYNYNYCYISDFGRYYFITDWTIDNGFWVATMKVDVLASMKSVITGSTQYVLRSASRKNGDIVDDMYPCRGQTVVANRSFNVQPFTALTQSSTTYCIVIGTVGGNANGYDKARVGVSYYSLTFDKMNQLISWMNQNISDYLNVTDITPEMLKSLYNPFQYIVSAKFFPCSVPYKTDANHTQIQFGFWQTPATLKASLCDGTKGRFITHKTYHATVSDHPQAASRGSYLNMAPFRELTLHAPPFGDIPLDTTNIIGKPNIFTKIMIDLFTGDAALQVKASNAASSTDFDSVPEGVMLTAYANIAFDIPLAQVRSDYVGELEAAAGFATGTTNALLSGSVTGVISSAVSGLANAARAAMPDVQIRPNQGGALPWYDDWFIKEKCMYVVDDDNADLGSPLCEDVTLSTLSGYCLISNPDLSDSSFTSEECEQVKQYMEKGFFLE